MKTKQQKAEIIERELKLAATRWSVEPEDIITFKSKQSRCVSMPEYCARYDVILALRDNWISNRDIAALFRYKDPSSVGQLIAKFKQTKQYEAKSN